MQKPFSLKARIKSFRFALDGLKYVIYNEHNFRIHLFAALVVIALGFYLQITSADWLWLIVAIGLVMVAEIINSAIENLVDLISPQQQKKAGLIKDMAAAAVLIASITAAIIGVLTFYPFIL
uniref:diacylglycerol kinase family protein n=2 Tax=Roseivirga sp. TaxID=1964215 RepID=UPI00404719A4